MESLSSAAFARLPDGSVAEEGTFRLNDTLKVTLYETSFLSTYGGYPVDFGKASVEASLTEDIDLSLGTYLNKAYYWYASPYKYFSAQAYTSSGLKASASTTLQNLTLLVGGEARFVSQEGAKVGLVSWVDTTSKTDTSYSHSGRLKFYGLYAQATFTPVAALSIYCGLRFDSYSSYEGKSYYIKSDTRVETDYPEHSESALSPRLGLTVRPSESFEVYGAYGKAFRAPTEYELYNEWYYYSTLYKGNPELKPEKGELFELGAAFGGSAFKISAAGYFGGMNDMIGTRELDSSEVAKYNEEHGTNFSKIKEKANIAAVDVKGLELGLKVKPLSWVKLEGGFGLNNLTVEDNPVDTASVGKQVTGVPEETYYARLTLERGLLGACLGLRGRSKVFGSSDNSDTLSGVFGSYDPYTVLDASLWLKLSETAKLSLAVYNLTDEVYYDYYLMPGRRLEVGVSAEVPVF